MSDFINLVGNTGNRRRSPPNNNNEVVIVSNTPAPRAANNNVVILSNTRNQPRNRNRNRAGPSQPRNRSRNRNRAGPSQPRKRTRTRARPSQPANNQGKRPAVSNSSNSLGWGLVRSESYRPSASNASSNSLLPSPSSRTRPARKPRQGRRSPSYSPNRSLVRYNAVVNAAAAAAVIRDHVKARFGDTELHPHQIAAVNLFIKPDTSGLLLYYKVGSGKTLASIAAAENLFLREGRRRPVVVVTPASLRENYKKEMRLARVDPRGYTLLSYEKVHTMGPRKREDLGRGAVLILDEAHTLRNPDSKRLDSLLQLSRHAHKRLLLTGTPVYNFPCDIGPLLAIINPANIPFTTSIMERVVNRRGQETTRPRYLFIDYFGRDASENQAQLNAMLRCTVLHYTPGPEVIQQYPTTTEHFEEVTITRAQAEAQFEEFKESHPLINQLTQEANASAMFTKPRMYNTSWRQDHPKLDRIVARIEKALRRPGAKCVVYSAFLEYSLKKLQRLLRDWGIHSEILEGKLSDRQKEELVQRYNAGELRVLMLSDAGKEGLDLKHTTELHIVEPQWNMEKVRQVKGRVVRYRSHFPERGHVDIYTYCAKLPNIPRRPDEQRHMGLMFSKTADEVLHDISRRKDTVNHTFLNRLHAISQQNLESCL